MMASTFKERFVNYADPVRFMGIAIYCYVTILIGDTIRDRSLDVLSDLPKIRRKAFGRFWLTVSPAAEDNTPAQPLQGAFTPLPSLLGSASGDILELGPGSGRFFVYLNPVIITSLYGVEPASEFHEALRQSADAVGLGAKFQILPCGAQSDSLLPALSKSGLLSTQDMPSEGHLFDTIISIRSLCSLPDLEVSLQTIYRLLRPGGRVIICEHVVNPWPAKGGSLVGRTLQLVYMALGWTYFIGDCHLARDTITLLRKAADVDGGWESVELQRDQDWAVLPWVTGVLTKKRSL